MKTALKALPYIAVVVGLYLLGSWIYSSGANSVQVEWNKAKETHQAKIDELQKKYDDLEFQHNKLSSEVSNDLAQKQKEYELSLAGYRADYDKRVRKSEDRAAFYKRQAESGSPECSSLASHAAELDRSLERGRDLVQRLGATVRLREQQLILLGSQITADRALFNESDK